MKEQQHRASQPTTEHPALDVLLVRLDQELYAIPAEHLRGVSRYRPVTPVPGAPAALPGILSLRGAIIPVVDPRALLGLAQAEPTRAARLALLAHEDGELALFVDAVLDLVALPPESVEVPPAALEPARARLLRGVGRFEGQPAMLLDLGELIASVRDWT
jgi:purine-binding chemotaxis protein CheW